MVTLCRSLRLLSIIWQDRSISIGAWSSAVQRCVQRHSRHHLTTTNSVAQRKKPPQSSLYTRGSSRAAGFEQRALVVESSGRYRALQQTIQQAANRPSEAALTARELSPSHTRRPPTTDLLDQPNSAREPTPNPPSTGRRTFGLNLALTVYRAAHPKGSVMLLSACLYSWLLLFISSQHSTACFTQHSELHASHSIASCMLHTA